MSSFQILTHNHSKRIVEIKILDFFLSDPVQTVWFGSLTHSGTLAFELGLKYGLSLACKLVQKVASFLLFFIILKFHLKSLDLSLFLEGGWGSRKDYLVTL